MAPLKGMLLIGRNFVQQQVPSEADLEEMEKLSRSPVVVLVQVTLRPPCPFRILTRSDVQCACVGKMSEKARCLVEL